MATADITTKYSSSDDSSSDDMQTQGQPNLFPKQTPSQPGRQFVLQRGKTPPPPLPPIPIPQIQMEVLNNLNSSNDNPGERINNPLNKVPSGWKLQNNEANNNNQYGHDGNQNQTTSPKSIQNNPNAKLYCIVTYRILTVFLAIYAIVITMILLDPHDNKIYNVCRPSIVSSTGIEDKFSNETDILIFETKEPSIPPTTNIVFIDPKNRTNNPSISPTEEPTMTPTTEPTILPSQIPSRYPSKIPTKIQRIHPQQSNVFTIKESYRSHKNPTRSNKTPKDIQQNDHHKNAIHSKTCYTAVSNYGRFKFTMWWTVNLLVHDVQIITTFCFLC